jgi:hypothetical protein
MLFEWLFHYRFSNQPRGIRPIHDKERCLGYCVLRVERFGEALCRAVPRRKAEHEKQDDRDNCGNHISNENKLSGRHRNQAPFRLKLFYSTETYIALWGGGSLGRLAGQCAASMEYTGNKKTETTPKYSNRKRKSGSLGTRDNRILSDDDLPLPIAF